MNDILRTYMERFREDRHTLRRYTAFVLALAMITTLFVNWQLHGVGISMTAQYQCGEEEHTHTADCYTKVLTCGYNEGDLENAAEVAAAEASQPSAEDEIMPLALEPQIEFVPHEHTEDCYTEVQTLTCMEEEHVHGDDCFDPEDGSLICDKFEHTHDESLEWVGKNGWRFVNAVSDFATHADPIRKTRNYNENLFLRTAEGNPMIDKAYKMVLAAA